MDTRGAVEVDQMVTDWRRRMIPQESLVRMATGNDPHLAATLEHLRRMAHHYDKAMEVLGIDTETRRKVLSIVLLGDPSGLEAIERHRVEQLMERAAMLASPAPINLNPLWKES